MVKNRKFKFGITVSVLIITIFAFIPHQVSADIPSVEGYILDAFYADLDGENDIYDIQFQIQVYINDFTNDDFYYGYQVVLFVGLGLPSGTEYWYQINVISYYYYFNLIINFYDAAIESGWYAAHLITLSDSSEDELFYHRVIFDPPGSGVGGGRPTSVEVWAF